MGKKLNLKLKKIWLGTKLGLLTSFLALGFAPAITHGLSKENYSASQFSSSTTSNVINLKIPQKINYGINEIHEDFFHRASNGNYSVNSQTYFHKPSTDDVTGLSKYSNIFSLDLSQYVQNNFITPHDGSELEFHFDSGEFHPPSNQAGFGVYNAYTQEWQGPNKPNNDSQWTWLPPRSNNESSAPQILTSIMPKMDIRIPLTNLKDHNTEANPFSSTIFSTIFTTDQADQFYITNTEKGRPKNPKIGFWIQLNLWYLKSSKALKMQFKFNYQFSIQNRWLEVIAASKVVPWMNAFKTLLQNYYGVGINKINFIPDHNLINLDQAIAPQLKRLHEIFQSKDSQNQNQYPTNQRALENKIITYLMAEITDPNNKYFHQLFQSLRQVIYYNIASKYFYKSTAADVQNLVKAGVIFPNYFQIEDNDYHFIKSDFLYNTLTQEEISAFTQRLLSNMVSYLTTDFSDFGYAWYSKIPKSLFPQQHFNSTIAPSEYLKLISALTTNLNENPVVINGYRLEKIQTEIQAQLVTQIKTDTEKVLTKFRDENSLTISDNSQEKFQNFLQKYHVKVLDAEMKNFAEWNYHFSRPNFLSLILNKDLLTDFKGLSLVQQQIAYSKMGTQIISSWTWNNAWITYQWKPKSQADPEVLLANLFSLIKQDLKANFNSYFQIKEASFNKPITHLTSDDYEPTEKYTDLQKLFNVKINFAINKNPSTENPQNQKNLKLNFNVDFKWISNDAQLSNANPPYYSKEEHFQIEFDYKNNLIQSKVNQAPELTPILPERFAHIFKPIIIYDINSQQKQYFVFNNQNPDLGYKVIHAEELDNGDVKLTIHVYDLKNPSIFKTYQKIIPSTLFKQLSGFDKKAAASAQIINAKTKQKYGSNLYDKKISEYSQTKIFEEVLQKVKSDKQFTTNSEALNLEIFKITYQKALLAILLDQPDLLKNNNKVDAINNYYANLKTSFDDLFKKANISPNSSLAKSIEEKLNNQHKAALKDPDNFNFQTETDPELKDMLNLLNLEGTNTEILKGLGKFIEKYKYDDLKNILNTTQKSVLYGVMGLTGVILLGSILAMFRTVKINSRQFKIKKSLLISLSAFLIMASASGLIYLLLYILGAL